MDRSTKYVVAVSGGVDSMVLLDMMHRDGEHEIIVAHFDHGIRADSSEDALFVAAAAQRYGYRFETAREELGPDASEARARERRYAFLIRLAKKHGASIVTAHHLDDLVESVAINLERGTGWRGLSVFDSNVIRPLIDLEKSALVSYAKTHDIVWREDSTNASDAYLRNRIRRKTDKISTDQKRQLRALHAHQKALKREIEKEVRELIGDGPEYSRYLLAHLPLPVALECLRAITNANLTRPQLMRALHAVKVQKPGSTFEAGNGINLYFTTRHFKL